MAHWSEFGVRHGPVMSARSRARLPAPLVAVVEERTASLDEPLTGLVVGDRFRPGLFPSVATGVSTGPITEVAVAFLDALTPTQRQQVLFPIDAPHWRTWINVHMNLFRHGLLLEDLPGGARHLVLALLQATLSARGYAQARDIMRLNGLLAELSGTPDAYGEWVYFVSIFGNPAGGEPWGWQLDGHHLNVHCVVVGDQVVLTPTFMGAEPTSVDDGPLAGTRVFAAEERAGLDLMRSLDPAQRDRAVLRPSIRPGDLPVELQHPFDGRMRGGAFHDNVTVPDEGVRATELSDGQRRLLRGVLGVYVGWARDGHNEVRMAEVDAHLDDTWFCWMGGHGDDDPFYYRAQSPVVLVEFDHHPGVVFDNEVPSRHHVHTVVRTPNGGDYGADLLRHHHDRYDHSGGGHVPRR